MSQFELNFEESPDERLLRLKTEYRDQVGVSVDTDDGALIEEYLRNPVAERARRVLKEKEDDRQVGWQHR